MFFLFVIVLCLVAVVLGFALGRLPGPLKLAGLLPAVVWIVIVAGLHAGWWGHGPGEVLTWPVTLVIGGLILLSSGVGMLASLRFASRSRRAA